MTTQTVQRLRRTDVDIPELLRRDVRLLGDTLGVVLTESGGTELFDDVERLRRATIELRSEPSTERRQAVVDLVAGFDPDRAHELARAFTLYFQLINLAEERQRMRALRAHGRRNAIVPDSIADAVAEIRALDGPETLDELLEGLEITPVFTAHPTEARRRAIVDGLNRVAGELQRFDDPALPEGEQAEVRRRLLEEITSLWATAQVRPGRPTPLDEVRRIMAVFDQTLFRLVPAVYRELDRALAPDDVGARPPTFSPFLRWGSWVGGDRDGNPQVTADITRETVGVQAEHVLRGLTAAVHRVARSLTASDAYVPPSDELCASLTDEERDFPELAGELAERPSQPHQRKLALIAHRLEVTRTEGAGAYAEPKALVEDLLCVQRSLADGGAPRLAYGELQHLVWQAQTFGFHLASLEVRQDSELHEEVLRELIGDDARAPAALERLATQGWPDDTEVTSDTGREAIATLQAMADLQARYGTESCRRYVVSFTRDAADLVAVRALARLAVADRPLALDVVPLFETRADLEAAIDVLDEFIALPGEAERLRANPRLEVMLGYSDSAKDAGFLSANVALYMAQERFVTWARDREIALTLFHGRGGAMGRGGGPTNRAVRSQAPGSVACRFKVTEQGEVIAARYGSRPVAQRHLEQVTGAVLVASAPRAEKLAGITDHQRQLVETMSTAAEEAYRDLVGRDGFADFFRRVTPSEEISLLPLGSRPSQRSPEGGLESLRAIPWVFAWSQSRVNLTGWYGLGSGLAAAADLPDGPVRLQELYREWPFFTSLLENAQMSLLKADALIAELYLRLGDRPELTEAIADEFERTRQWVLAVTGHKHLLADRPVLRRSVELRNPYVDALSFLQVHALGQLRAGADEEASERIANLVMLTVNGVAAGLQNTG